MARFIKIFVLALLLPVSVKAEQTITSYDGFLAQQILLYGETVTSLVDNKSNFTVLYHIKLLPEHIKKSDFALDSVFEGFYVCMVSGVMRPLYSCTINMYATSTQVK